MKNITYEETIKRIEELEPYMEIEGTELGEAWNLLCDIHNRCDYLSDHFGQEIRKEIKEQLEYIKKHAKITEEKIDPKQSYVIKDIVWDNE